MSNEELRRRSAETAATYSQGNIAKLDDAMTRRLVASTVMTESSGGNLAMVNAQGYTGRYQAGAQWLVDAGYVDGDKLKVAMKGYRTEWAWADAGKRDNMDQFLADPSNWKNDLSLERYLASAELQDKAFKINSDAAYGRAIKEGVLQETDPPEKIAGFLKARHISGYGGAKAAVTDGKEIEDSNGTSNYDYYNDIAVNRDGLNKYMGLATGQTQIQHNERTLAGPLAGNKLQRGERGDAVRDLQPTPNLLKRGSEGQEVWDLQTTLRGLGYPGADGKPLATDKDFGPNTDHAVRAFQKAHGLEPVDGKVGKDTRAALVQAAQHPLVSEAPHPNHTLYAAIGAQLPAGTDPKTIANVTLQALENGITGPGRLQRMAVVGSDVYLQGSVPGDRVKVDLTAPTPELQAMSDHMVRQTAERTQEDPRRQQGRQPQVSM